MALSLEGTYRLAWAISAGALRQLELPAEPEDAISEQLALLVAE